jgi:hypothetical protein
MAGNNDDDWEYEYDENETEDFYIPIDLANVPSAQIPTNSERRPGHPTLLKSRLRALNATRGQVPDTIMDGNSTQEPATMGEVQIQGLHTANPLVMYNGQLLSCQWTSTIGTDLYFTKPQTDEGDLHQTLRSLPSVDLLSVGTAKLIARVGRLRPRDELFENSEDTQPVAISADNAEKNQGGSNANATETQVPTTTKMNSAPNSFLSRLNEAKARRGEASRLTLTHTPDGSRLLSETTDVTAHVGENGISQSLDDVPMGGT